MSAVLGVFQSVYHFTADKNILPVLSLDFLFVAKFNTQPHLK